MNFFRTTDTTDTTDTTIWKPGFSKMHVYVDMTIWLKLKRMNHTDTDDSIQWERKVTCRLLLMRVAALR